MKVTEKTLNSINNAFERENIQTNYRVLGYEIDIYFHDYKIAVEIDEKYHRDSDISREIESKELILIKKILIFLRLKMKYLGTLKNQI